jgi:hypothetical protein
MAYRDMLVADPEIRILVSPEFKRHPNVERLWERFGMKDRLVYVNPKDTVYAEEVRRCVLDL